MKALVVKAPHAPLQALGVYEFETRGFAPRTTLAAGDPVAIVLGRKVKPYDERPEAWQRLARSMGWAASYTDEAVNAVDLAEAFRQDEVRCYPLGSVIAVVTFDAALRMIPVEPYVGPLSNRREDREAAREWAGRWKPGRAHIAIGGLDGGPWLVEGTGNNASASPLMDQKPLGDFTVGRSGWLLSNPHRLTTPVPCPAIRPDGTRTVMQGVFTLPDDVHEAVAAQLP
jgi:hypothetical protein